MSSVCRMSAVDRGVSRFITRIQASGPPVLGVTIVALCAQARRPRLVLAALAAAALVVARGPTML